LNDRAVSGRFVLPDAIEGWVREPARRSVPCLPRLGSFSREAIPQTEVLRHLAAVDTEYLSGDEGGLV
jgi:hypothetical protein